MNKMGKLAFYMVIAAGIMQIAAIIIAVIVY